MNTKELKIIYYYAVLMLLLMSCSESKTRTREEVLQQRVSPEAYNVITRIKASEYNNYEKNLESIAELKTFETDSIAQLIAKFYDAKMNYLNSHAKRRTDKLLKVYSELKANKLPSYLAEVDILLIMNAFTFLEFEIISQRFEQVREYITLPGQDAAQEALLLGLSSSPSVATPERVEEILEAIERIKNEKWSVFHYFLHINLSNTYNDLEKIDKAKEVLLQSIKKSEEAAHFYFASKASLQLSFIEKDVDKAIEYCKKGLQTYKNTGYKEALEIFHRVLGHHYMKQGKFLKAHETYLEALRYSISNGTKNGVSVSYAYAGWSLFKSDHALIDKVEEQYYSKAIELSEKKGLPYTIALQRRLWSNYSVGRLQERNKIKLLLEEHKAALQRKNEEISNQNIIDKTFARSQLLRSEIRGLEIENNAKQKQLILQKYVGGIMLLATLFLSAFLYSFRQRLGLLEIVKKKNEELSEKQIMLKSELKNKLTLITNNLRTFEKMHEVIEEEKNISFKTRKEIKSLIRPEQNKRLIEEIDFQFLDQHKEFQRILARKHPNLTANNIRLCIFLKLNLSSKEISTLMFSSVDAIKVARSRMRKKLSIEDKSISLSSYLNSI